MARGPCICHSRQFLAPPDQVDKNLCRWDPAGTTLTSTPCDYDIFSHVKAFRLVIVSWKIRTVTADKVQEQSLFLCCPPSSSLFPSTRAGLSRAPTCFILFLHSVHRFLEVFFSDRPTQVLQVDVWVPFLCIIQGITNHAKASCLATTTRMGSESRHKDGIHLVRSCTFRLVPPSSCLWCCCLARVKDDNDCFHCRSLWVMNFLARILPGLFMTVANLQPAGEEKIVTLKYLKSKIH